MKFLLVIEQSEACDYSIGCGTAIRRFEAESVDEAIAYVRAARLFDEDAKDDQGDHDLFCTLTEEDVYGAHLYCVSSDHELPLRTWEIEAQERKERSAADEQAAKERQEYERLKAKFGAGA